MTKHYSLLRNYVVEVAKDLVRDGKIRKKQGENIERLIQGSAQIIATEIASDLRALAMELGVSFVTSATSMIEQAAREHLDGALGSVKGSLFEFLADVAAGKKRRP